MSEENPELTPEMYAQLHQLAYRIVLERAGRGQTLQPTALLHEAWVKLSRSSSQYRSQAHFMAGAAQAMRQIMVDQARARMTAKRGRDLKRTTLAGVGDQAYDLLELDELLEELGTFDPSAARITLLRVFGGLTVSEVAEVMGISTSTVTRSWRFARAFLADRMGG
ncbi:MAG: ECF-type sigma factor [Myxococcota bacterium]